MTSCLLVGCACVCAQTRILKNDFARYNMEDDEDVINDDEIGWKIIHTDVFRFPAQKSLFCAILGLYTHLLLLGGV